LDFLMAVQCNPIAQFLPFLLILIVIFVIFPIFYKWRQRKLQIQKAWSAIDKGDSQSKVASMVGKPNSVENEDEDSGQVTWIYDCGTKGKRIITFKDGFIEKIEVKY